MKATPALKQERLRQAEYAAMVELEKARQVLSQAQSAYNLARRRHKKAQEEYFASRERL